MTNVFNISPSDLKLGAVLARGSPGVTLYQADLQIGDHTTKVAVKRLNTSNAPASAESLFLKEIQSLQLASSICHRACRMLGLCKLDGDACIVMTLYPKSAAKRLEELQGPLSLHELTGIALEILEGLTQLHAANILHLDLKPGNILLDEYGHAYVADFGISYALRTLEACTPCTSISGTPHYMAPEQADAEFGVRGPHTDMWGFAACVLHLATGQQPYHSLTHLQLVSAMFKRKAPEVPDSLPSWLRQALQQCLSFEPAARPSATQLQQVFQRQFHQGQAVQGQTSQHQPAQQPKIPGLLGFLQALTDSLRAGGLNGQGGIPVNVTAGSDPAAVTAGSRPAAITAGSRPAAITARSRPQQQPRGPYNKQASCDLLEAAQRGRVQRVETLLLNGADPEATDSDGKTPLHWAVWSGQLECVRCLLTHGADTHVRALHGFTPLHLIWGDGQKAIVNLLHSDGADLDAQDDTGETLLMRAAQSGWPVIVKLLVSLGADTTLKDKLGRTARRIAHDGKCWSCLEALPHT